MAEFPFHTEPQQLQKQSMIDCYCGTAMGTGISLHVIGVIGVLTGIFMFRTQESVIPACGNTFIGSYK